MVTWPKRLFQKRLDLLYKKQVWCLYKIYEVENQIGKKVKCVRIDNGIEYMNKEFLTFCEECDIKSMVNSTIEVNEVVA